MKQNGFWSLVTVNGGVTVLLIMGTATQVIPRIVNDMDTFPQVIPKIVNNIGTFPQVNSQWCEYYKNISPSYSHCCE